MPQRKLPRPTSYIERSQTNSKRTNDCVDGRWMDGRMNRAVHPLHAKSKQTIMLWAVIHLYWRTFIVIHKRMVCPQVQGVLEPSLSSSLPKKVLHFVYYSIVTHLHLERLITVISHHFGGQYCFWSLNGSFSYIIEFISSRTLHTLAVDRLWYRLRKDCLQIYLDSNKT